jgi:hypothetical protein
LALLKKSPSPDTEKEQNHQRKSQVNGKTLPVIVLDGLFGNSLKPIRLAEFFATYSPAGRGHALLGRSGNYRVKRAGRKQLLGEKITAYT